MFKNKCRYWSKEDSHMSGIFDDIDELTNSIRGRNFNDFIIMSSSGIINENNEDIFENDIVRYEEDGSTKYGVVKYKRDIFVIKTINGDSIGITTKMNVIGNVFANKSVTENFKEKGLIK